MLICGPTIPVFLRPNHLRISEPVPHRMKARLIKGTKFMRPIIAFAILLFPLAAVAGLPEPSMTSIQPELLAMPGSLSNAWGDFDRDGDLDLAVSLKSGEVRLYRNDEGTLVSIGGPLGLPTAGGEFRGLSWGDYDSDGWLDLMAGSTLPDKPSAVFHNVSGKRFVNVAEALGLTVPGRSSRQNNWIDYDNDGDVDIYTTDRTGANKLFRNDGGRFTQVFAAGAPTVTSSTVGACWLDFDKDGDLDLFLGNQSGKADQLLRNDGDKGFSDVAPQLGMTSLPRTKDEGGVGCAVGDYDRDGELDIFVPNYGHNALWHNNGDGSFTNTAKETDVGIENHAVGTAWGDYDNDGYPDLVVMSYVGDSPVSRPKDSLFHNEGGKRFINVLDEGSPLNAGDHGVSWVDYNNDGAIDLSVTRGYTEHGSHFVFRNNLPADKARQSLSVMVLDAKGRYTQAGAEVRVYGAKGQLLGAGQVSTGGGYNSQNAAPVHFGLPGQTRVTVEVTFMGNTGRKVHRIPNVTPVSYFGRSLVVRRPVGF